MINFIIFLIIISLIVGVANYEYWECERVMHGFKTRKEAKKFVKKFHKKSNRESILEKE